GLCTFKCHADEPLAVSLDGLHVDDKLHFVEEPMKIMDCEVKRLKQSCIPLVKIRWNSKQGPEFTLEREDQFKQKAIHSLIFFYHFSVLTSYLRYSKKAAISFPPKAEVERLLAMPTLSPSPLTSLSPSSAGERLFRCTTPAALPSPSLPPPLHILPPIDHRDDIPKTKMPPRKRLCLSTLGSRYEVEESSTARLTRGQGIDYGFFSTLDAEARRRGIKEVRYGIRDTWIDPAETIYEIAPMTVEVVITTASGTDGRDSPVMGDMRREMGVMQAKLLALREQPRRAGQAEGDARVPHHQDALRDADSHI
nr:putative reverse transcriptase domain-containing protein [Tanacetum cinerariifolium]